jgi:hypothetical protein
VFVADLTPFKADLAKLTALAIANQANSVRATSGCATQRMRVRTECELEVLAEEQ